ncbi:mechanosensitive ion channel family protein [Salipaludibacillus daqingensis]|uniref:mechanosensitive ion channel family protein n=1 Tax=Salipaludibacillus daqingensis TaxID=3041001 RepID=UPI002473AA48|nr:mechanosensitive ion channel family protein [Salipaludibacillus daqingensis]
MNRWITLITWQEAMIATGIFFLFLVFRKIFTTYVFKTILYFSRKAPTELVTNILLAFEKPLRSFFVVIGFYVVFLYLPFPERFDDTAYHIFRTLLIVHIGWGLFHLSASSSVIFTKVGERLDIQFDEIVVPFLSKLIRFALVAMVLSIIASEWDYNVSGFVAGLGLGGLAFALAAQDSISNFFGGVIIITEKPFTLGDWVSTPSVEGFVEDISFRSTKIRTFADSLVVVPNSTLANEPVENWTKMGKRQISFNLGVLYSTPRNKIQTCVERIDEMLRKRDDIDQELIIVRFSEFNDSSLDIFLYFFTKSTIWVEYMEVKQDVNLQIMNILEEEGVSIAYPTRSIHLEDKSKDIEQKKDPE